MRTVSARASRSTGTGRGEQPLTLAETQRLVASVARRTGQHARAPTLTLAAASHATINNQATRSASRTTSKVAARSPIRISVAEGSQVLHRLRSGRSRLWLCGVVSWSLIVTVLRI